MANDLKRKLLEEAIAAVADRGLNYGSPEDNFGRIAALWNAHLNNRAGNQYVGDTTIALHTISSHDVAMMMILMKIARLENDQSHKDSWIDVAGYAACGGSM